MHKDELIQLHTLLCQLKNWFQANGALAGTPFVEYDEFDVLPQHIHKSKMAHKRAVFLLGKELAQAIGGMEELSGAHRVGNRLSELAKKVADVKRLDPVPAVAHG